MKPSHLMREGDCLNCGHPRDAHRTSTPGRADCLGDFLRCTCLSYRSFPVFGETVDLMAKAQKTS